MPAVSTERKVWTILDMLQWGTTYLADRGFDESRLTTELLLAHILQCKRIDLYTKFDKPLNEAELASFKTAFKRRLEHEPLQYIVGETEFMGLKFFVDPRVLIPRPETETLVEAAVEICSNRLAHQQQVRVLDIGTGSGCVAVSLAKMIPAAKVLAIDKSADAVEVAKRNAEENHTVDRIEFTHLDIVQIPQKNFSEKFHLIVSNPPYISNREFSELPPEIRDYEPRFALTDEGDGLGFYRFCSSVAKSFLEPNGVVLVEHAFNQADEVERVFRSAGWKQIEKRKDYSGNFRCLIAAMEGE
ncbi:MAG: peptide chain release factor N(5)-glutamine methyltransferase [Bacteroidota bacterium]|nr:peptide chain release factor N(5)-glutamine methyltransferase [Bacteroidota bacterium]